MSLAVYSAFPMVLNDGEKEYRFTLKLNPSTDSFRLENGEIKRSVFIGRRLFNKMFQLIRNEYGTVMGRIHYTDNEMKHGSASTTEHEQFNFEIREGSDMEVIIEKEHNPLRKLRATIPNNIQNKLEREVQHSALIPSVLAALIFSREASLIA
jgi:hypothetical protein